jgi:sigma-B regulation protein RsbU (phosphoserine phosphatase)
MSYDMLVFNNNYTSVLTQLSLMTAAGSLKGGYVFYCDEARNVLVYLMDSTPENSPGYHYPVSVVRLDSSDLHEVIRQKTSGTFFEDNICRSAYPITLEEKQGQIIAYVSFDCSVESIANSQRNFMLTGGLITLGATLLLALVYLLFVDRFIVRHISSLSQAAGRFTDQLDTAETLHPVPGGVKTHDELGDLSGRLDLMQNKLLEYVGSLAEKTAREESMKAELNVASRIQMESLPKSGFSIPGVRLDSFIQPAREVGGDLYDYFMIDADHLFFVIADVSGKGVPAALFMMATNIILTECTHMRPGSPGEILTRINGAICAHNRAEMFVTIWLGILELSTGKLIAANAGHEDPALCRCTGRFELWKTRHGVAIGVMEGVHYRDNELQLDRGDRLFLYTDGVPEATDAHTAMFTLPRMLETLDRHRAESPRAILEGVQRAVDAFVGEAPQFDDLTMLCLHYLGPVKAETPTEPAAAVTL